MTFKPGKSGNPLASPRARGTKPRLAIESLLDGEARAITRKAVDMAKGRDSAAMRPVKPLDDSVLVPCAAGAPYQRGRPPTHR